MVVGYLLVLALLALVCFILIFHHFRRSIAEGRPEPLGFIRIATNWILLFVFVGSLGGAGYIAFQNHKTSVSEQHAQTSTASSSSSTARATNDTVLAKVSVSYTPKNPVLTENSTKVKFKVSPQTELTIKGHYSGTEFKVFKAQTNRKVEHFNYDFTTDGTYDLIVKRGHKIVTKQLVIKDGQVSSSSSSRAVISSSSSSSSISSSHSSSVTQASSASVVAGRSTTHTSSAHSSYSTPARHYYSSNTAGTGTSISSTGGTTNQETTGTTTSTGTTGETGE